MPGNFSGFVLSFAVFFQNSSYRNTIRGSNGLDSDVLSFADLFSKLPISNNSFRDTIRVSNGLDTVQD